MKILALFVDMLSTEYMNLCNKNISINCMDIFLQDLGGTLFSNCYAVAPDTPRSAACMWSGLYPKKNLCTNRVKWPRDFLNRDADNIWKILKLSGHTVNIFMDDNAYEMGLIPLCGNEHVYTESIYQFFEQADLTEDSFNFFYLPDLHYVLDELDYRMAGYEEALEFQLSVIKEIMDFYDAKELFDNIILFSDHGFKPTDMESGNHIIEDIRTKIAVQIYKKDDGKLFIDDRLRANLDLMPTICELLNYTPQNEIDGISFFDEQGHGYVMIEDLGAFGSWFGQSIEHWAVILRDQSKHWLECDGSWEHSDSLVMFDEKKYEKLIQDKMCGYEENRVVSQTARRYQKYMDEHKNTGKYSNGQFLFQKIYRYRDEERLLGKRIVLYGAGRVGRDYYQQIAKCQGCEIVAWIDSNYFECHVAEGEVEGIGRLLENDYDYVLIGIWDAKTAKQISSMLEQLHISLSKILWSQPQIQRVPRDT